MDYPGGPKKDTRILILKRQEGQREGRKGNRTVKTKVRVTQVHPSIAGSSSHWKSRGSVPAPTPPHPPHRAFQPQNSAITDLCSHTELVASVLQQPRGTRVPPRGPLSRRFPDAALSRLRTLCQAHRVLSVCSLSVPPDGDHHEGRKLVLFTAVSPVTKHLCDAEQTFIKVRGWWW